MTQDLEQDLSLYGPEQNWEMSKIYIKLFSAYDRVKYCSDRLITTGDFIHATKSQ